MNRRFAAADAKKIIDLLLQLKFGIFVVAGYIICEAAYSLLKFLRRPLELIKFLFHDFGFTRH